MNKSEINNFINKLMEKTERNELNWKPAREFFEERNHGSGFAASELACSSCSDWATLHDNDSFYLEKNNQYLFLLHVDHESGKDSTITESWGLYAILDLNDDMFVTIPDYHPANTEDRIKKISDIIKKNNAADEAKQEKRLLDFFNSII